MKNNAWSWILIEQSFKDKPADLAEALCLRQQHALRALDESIALMIDLATTNPRQEEPAESLSDTWNRRLRARSPVAVRDEIRAIVKEWDKTNSGISLLHTEGA